VSGRTVLVLAAVVAGMAAFIAFYERDLPSSEERGALAQQVLGIDVEAVRGLTIESEAATVRLEKGAGGLWRLLEPVSAAADGEAVDQLVEALVGLDKQRTLTAVEAAAVGLDPPRLRVDLQLEDGGRRLDLGSAVPGSRSVVASVGDDPHVYVVADSILSELEREPDLWRDRVLFHGDRGSVERLVFGGTGERRALVRRGTEFWLESPLLDPADEDRVSELLADLEALRVGTFVDGMASGGDGGGGLEGMGLNPPESILEVWVAGEETPFRLEVGAQVAGLPNRRYGKVGEQLFEADSELFALLARPTAVWLSPRWTRLRPYQINRLTFSGRLFGDETEARAVEWLRRDGLWQRGEDRLEASILGGLLAAVTGAEAEVVAAGAEAADLRSRLGEAEWTLILVSDDGSEEVLTAWPALPDGRFPVGAAGRDSVLLLPAATAAEVDQGLRTAATAPPLDSVPDVPEEGAG